MKVYLRRWLIAVVAALALGLGSVQAQTKIGLVDMKKVFDGYFKTEQAAAQIKDHIAESEKTLKVMIEDYEKGSEEYKKLLDSANDQAVSAEEREKRKGSAEQKMLEIQDIEKSVTQFKRTTQANVQERNKRMRDGIVKEIRDVINARARSGSFTLIFDSSGESFNQTPVVLYADTSADLTKDILTELNSKAPPGYKPAAAATQP